MEARDDRQLLRFQKKLANLKLLIIDELGFVPLSKTGAELLFEVFSQRYERGSILVTSNLPFDEWTEVFGSERLTGALLDRLTHHVHILEMNGESFRLKQSREKTETRKKRLSGIRLPPWAHRPLPRAPRPLPAEGQSTPRVGPSRGLRGQAPHRTKVAHFCSATWPGFTPPLTGRWSRAVRSPTRREEP